MQRSEVVLQLLPVLLPSDSICPRGGFPLDGEVRLPKSFQRHMVWKSGKLRPLVLAGDLTHPFQRTGSPVRLWVRGVSCWLGFLLACPLPSTASAARSPDVLRRLLRYYRTVRPPRGVHHGRTSKISISKENKPDDTKKYLQDNGQGTPWLDREIHSAWTIPTGMSDKDFRDLVETGSPESIEAAVKNGANVNARDTNGTTMLMYAAWHNQNPVPISVLLNAGANVKARSSDGSSALVFAARHTRNAEVVTTLLKSGADINAQTKRGNNALMLAARYNQTLKLSRPS